MSRLHCDRFNRTVAFLCATHRAARCALAFCFFVIAGGGCGDSLKSPLESSVEDVQTWNDGNEASARMKRRVLAALAQASTESLQVPTIAAVGVFETADELYLKLVWLEEQPSISPVAIVDNNDGIVQMHEFYEGALEDQRREAAGVVVFQFGDVFDIDGDMGRALRRMHDGEQLSLALLTDNTVGRRRGNASGILTPSRRGVRQTGQGEREP